MVVDHILFCQLYLSFSFLPEIPHVPDMKFEPASVTCVVMIIAAGKGVGTALVWGLAAGEIKQTCIANNL